MRPDELSVLPAVALADRLTRIERAVEGIAACMGLGVDALVSQDVEGNSVERVERMVVDLAGAVRLQALWVREGERAGFFQPKQAVRARMVMREADIQSDLAQVERALQANPHPDLVPALEERARAHREKLASVQRKLNALTLTPFPHPGPRR